MTTTELEEKRGKIKSEGINGFGGKFFQLVEEVFPTNFRTEEFFPMEESLPKSRFHKFYPPFFRNGGLGKLSSISTSWENS